MTLRLQKIGNQQIMKVARSSSLNVEPPLPGSQPFDLIWEDGELDYHNPFFSYQKLVEDFKKMINDEQHNLPLASLCASFNVGLDLATTTSPKNGAVRCNEDDLMEHIGEPWKDKLAVINLRRVVKVLIDFSERQKIQIWRYWLGVDTYEQDSELDGPDPRDVWQVIERHMDEILELFIYQNSRYRFLHMISMLHSTSHPHHRVQSNSDLQLPECFSPITAAYPRTASQRSGDTSIDRTSQYPIMDQDSQRERLSRKQMVDFIGLHARSRFSFWSDVSNLLITFNWKLNDDINLKARVAKEIRTELNRLVKKNLKKWTKQSK
ncbi:hypothetical protein CROQUDRAFT_37442 [Cronartium quercuum f. sp. fusiforme G11]|uniref:Uncharacterized protein n=1 Tax=Cronartium quercuum f. sp. fusiforme G11 TaxID=708437 RepID=A0A9P6NPL2_9BASI|nr:hypothetical protein CROQUDRAFT_37442 [Cronartium quercuum f. sp. fusiforme G11]